MFKVLANAWKVKDIRKKLLFILFILLIYRIGTHVPLPGIHLAQLNLFRNGAGMDLTNIFSIIAGGGAGSIFTMGIAPYINASIIMQLLTVAIPKLEQIQKEGEEGRKKISQYTRFLAVGLALIQASATVYNYAHTQQIGSLFRYNNVLVYITAVVAMVAGTILIMWLAELLTERGIGNGSSFIIFANILSSLPQGVQSLALLVAPGAENLVSGWVTIILLLAIFAVLIGFVVMVQDGERRIPVQYSRKVVGRQMYGANSSFIPIKVNIAGVMSIIFAISLLQFPQQLLGLFPGNTVLQNITRILSLQNWIGDAIYIVLIFMFTFFYTSFAINTVEMAENMKKNGGFIPGIRPGKPTSDYVQKTVDRLSWIGALFYCLIAMAPILFQRFSSVQTGFGGTTLLIVTGVALEFIKQLESQLLMRHYKGFLT
ncbi:MAG: preprotein translocase subunit SecY [Clostridiales bacterium]|jgi:preprotein translocase subunit SecY|nr:preprotein translocase subunit SecY [Clostridiales bacterium]